MMSIINALYYSGHENDLQRFLSPDELADYQSACRYREEEFAKLSACLNADERALLERMADNGLEAAGLDMDCAFRYGLAIGLKLSGWAALLT